MRIGPFIQLLILAVVCIHFNANALDSFEKLNAKDLLQWQKTGQLVVGVKDETNSVAFIIALPITYPSLEWRLNLQLQEDTNNLATVELHGKKRLALDLPGLIKSPTQNGKFHTFNFQIARNCLQNSQLTFWEEDTDANFGTGGAIYFGVSIKDIYDTAKISKSNVGP